MRVRFSLLLAATVLLAIPAWPHPGHGNSHSPASAAKLTNPVAATTDQIKAGEVLYSKQCAACHGDDGKAEAPLAKQLKRRPADLTQYPMDSMRDGEIYWVIGHGIPPAMPSFAKQIDAADEWRVVLWVRELRHKQKLIEQARFGGYEWELPAGFPYPKVPADNPISEAKVELGRYLFYDKRLSANQTQSCASCHQQKLAFTDGKPRGVGSTGAMHPRGAMSLANVAYSPVLTWANPNMRRLEQQALIPLFGDQPVELGMSGKEDLLLHRIETEPRYGSLFRAAFPNDPKPYTLGNITKAIACFERTIISGRSPYDRYRFEGQQNAISAAAKRGESLFFSEQLECFHCHGGFNFTGTVDYLDKGFAEVEFHNTGLYNLPGEISYPPDNTGLYEFTHNPEDVGRFKAPTLRNIAITAPYMHDGSIPTLEQAIDHYQRGGRTVKDGPYAGIGADNANKSEFVRPFSLTPSQKHDLIVFLKSLTDDELLTDQRLSDPWQEDRAQETIRGRVGAINSQAGTILIKHIDGAAIMQGLTMEFHVRNGNELELLKPGATIEGTLEQDKGDVFLSHIHIVGSTK